MFCREMGLASTASWIGRRYELMFANTWQFDFIPQKNVSIGTCLVPGDWELEMYMEKYHGIKATNEDIKNIQDMVDIIKHQLINNMPFIVEFRYPSSNWLPNFDQGTHTLLMVVGLSDDEKYVYVHDIHLSYINKELHQIPISELFNGYTFGTLVSVTTDERKDINYHQLITDIVKKIMDDSNSSMFKRIKIFAEYFSDSLDFNSEIVDSTVPLEAPLIANIDTVERSRLLFSYFLEYVGNSINNRNILEISDRFASSKWKTIKTILIKSFYQKSLSKEKLSELSRIIKNIALEEEKTANDLLEAFTESSAVPQRPSRQINKPEKFYSIDISDFYNNNAFTTSMSNSFNADFTGADQCFFINSIEEINNVLTYKDITLSFPTIIDGKNNNISCNQQEIPVPNGCYSGLYLIATSEFGDAVDSITIVYDDEQLNLKVTISDWWKETPSYEEDIVWSGEVLIGKALESYIAKDKKCNIYAKAFPLPKEGYVKKIILPLCPNFHIFKIFIGT